MSTYREYGGTIYKDGYVVEDSAEIADALLALSLCEGCEQFPALLNSRFCAECQRDIDLDSRSEDPANTHGRP